MPPSEWYVAKGKQKLGPYTFPQLTILVSEAQLQPTDNILQVGTTKWVEARTLADLWLPAPFQKPPVQLAATPLPQLESLPPAERNAEPVTLTPTLPSDPPPPVVATAPWPSSSQSAGRSPKSVTAALRNINPQALLPVLGIIIVGVFWWSSRDTQAEIEAMKKSRPFEEAGHDELRKENYERAIQLFGSAIEICGKNVGAFYWRGVAYRRIGNREMAVKDFTKAIALKKDGIPFEGSKLYDDRGDIYYERADFRAAIADYSESLRLYPKSAHIYRMRGMAYAFVREYDKSFADLEEAIRKSPPRRKPSYDRDKARVHLLRGVQSKESGDADAAISDFTAAIELDRVFAEAYWFRGLTYVSRGEHARAKADSDEARRLNPDFR